MRNRNLSFPVRCVHAQQYFQCPVLDLVTSRSPHMGWKWYIPSAHHKKKLLMPKVNVDAVPENLNRFFYYFIVLDFKLYNVEIL